MKPCLFHSEPIIQFLSIIIYVFHEPLPKLETYDVVLWQQLMHHLHFIVIHVQWFFQCIMSRADRHATLGHKPLYKFLWALDHYSMSVHKHFWSSTFVCICDTCNFCKFVVQAFDDRLVHVC